MDKVKQLYVCECNGEALVMDYDRKDEELLLAFWSVGNKHRSNTLTWRERLRWIWHVIITGQPYTDMVILSRDTARELAGEILASTYAKKRTSRKRTEKTLEAGKIR